MTGCAKPVVGVLVPWLLAATAGEAQDLDRTFVATIGVDTVQVDRIRQEGRRIDGWIVLRVGRTGVTRYRAELAEDGSLRRFEAESRPAAEPEGEPARRLVAEYGPDSIRGSFTFRGDTREFVVSREGDPVPFASLYGVFHYEMLLRRVLAAGRDEAELRGLNNGGVTTVGARVLGPGRVRFEMGGGFGAVVVEAADDGHVGAIDATGTTIKMVYHPSEPRELETVAAEFARRDAAGEGLGTLSPGDEVAAAVHGAEISVTYSRPATRGRQIFGQVVPWGEVWRTGANAATVFTTTQDLVMAGRRVPAGSYSLWTIPEPSGWTLIVNRQTGQWGTRYDPTQDFARLPMEVGTLADPLERFTIGVEETDEGGVLFLRWAATEARIAFRVE